MMKASLGALSLALLAVACSSSSSTSTPGSDAAVPPDDSGISPTGACATTGSGSVTVNVVGLPAGATANVTAGTHALMAPGTTTLDGGSYVITAPTITTADPRVRAAYSATLSAASSCVKSGETTTVTVTYAPILTSNKLWMTTANSTSQLLGIASANLTGASMPTPDVSALVDVPQGITFDKDGGMWMPTAPGGTTQLSHFPASFAVTGGGSVAKAPDIAITGAALNAGAPAATEIAFDAHGNLWVSTPAVGKILRYDAAQLKVSGSPDPAVVISGLDTPKALAFDKQGNLWACEAGLNRVVEYAAARLTASTAAPPDIAITGNTGGAVVADLVGPRGLAFDATDGLWVNFDNRLVRLGTLERSASAALVPSVQIQINNAALVEALAFDETGGLWFAYTQSSVARLSPAQLTTSSAPGTSASPDLVLASGSIGSAAEVAFYPAPAALPLFHSLP